jgi:hypothetical protein
MKRNRISEATGSGNAGHFRVPIVLAPQQWTEDQLSPFTSPVYQYTNAELAYEEADGDFLESPEKINEPKYAVLSAFWFWNVNNCKKYCGALTEDNLLKVSKIINCGSINSNCAHKDKKVPCSTCKPNGWEKRQTEFNRLKNKFNCKK